MLIALIHIRVKPEFIEVFKQATLENARHSVRETGIARFDFIEQSDAQDRFVLVEVYRSPEAVLLHRETAHYATWRDTVADMMAEPRTRLTYSNLFPSDVDW